MSTHNDFETEQKECKVGGKDSARGNPSTGQLMLMTISSLESRALLAQGCCLLGYCPAPYASLLLRWLWPSPALYTSRVHFWSAMHFWKGGARCTHLSLQPQLTLH